MIAPENHLRTTTAALETRAQEHIIASDKSSLAHDELAEVRHQAKAEAIVWALSVLTGQNEGTIMARILTSLDD